LDNDARVPDLDEDNGVRLLGSIQPGFNTNIEVSIHNLDLRRFYLDAWFDWNDNGVFEAGEVRRFGSAGTGLSQLANGVNVISVAVPSNAILGEIYARFRLSEQANLGATGDASSGEVEDLKLIVTNNPFQNPVLRFDVNNSGLPTPLDALQIINAIGRNDGNNIFLDQLPLPPNLPLFPDVNGDGVVSSVDALQVINELERLPNSPVPLGELVAEGEWTGYLPTTTGVLASGATLLGDLLIAEALESSERNVEPESPAPSSASPSKTSVFDIPAVVEIDSIVDALAEDTALARSESEPAALDHWFASL
jgi:hypothetical protein